MRHKRRLKKRFVPDFSRFPRDRREQGAIKHPVPRRLARTKNMKVKKLTDLLAHSGDFSSHASSARFVRFAAMSGFVSASEYSPTSDDTEVPESVVSAILRLDYAERATDNLATMGREMGKLNISVPSNINVWQHVAGESKMAVAAKALTDAVSQMATR